MNPLNLKDKVAVVTGGGGVLCSTMAKGLAAQGVKTAILDLNQDAAKKVAQEIETEFMVQSVGISANVLSKESLGESLVVIHEKLGTVDYLLNGAGGNAASATTKNEFMSDANIDKLDDTFFGLQIEGFDKVFDLNFQGTLIPSMVFAKDMLDKKAGAIVNVSSMNAFTPLTKIPAYSAAKAAINNFTQWLAVHFAKTGVRVNAIAPGPVLPANSPDSSTFESAVQATPLQREVSLEELCMALTYLINANSVTGQILFVDSGQHLL